MYQLGRAAKSRCSAKKALQIDRHVRSISGARSADSDVTSCRISFAGICSKKSKQLPADEQARSHAGCAATESELGIGRESPTIVAQPADGTKQLLGVG